MAIRATAANGRFLSVGFASGKMPALAPNILLVKNLTLHGFFFGRYVGWTPLNERHQHAGELQHVMQTMLTWANEKRIRPAVSAVFPLGELKQALTVLETRQVIGKVALSISDKAAP